MYDGGGVPEQLCHFIVSPPPSAPPPLPPPSPPPARTFPFPLSFPSFDTHHHFLNSILHQQPISYKIDDEIKDANTELVRPADNHHRLDHDEDHDNDDDHDDGYYHRPWCSDEVLALFRIRSTMENWFPESTWEHVSRKLTDFGFKRTPQECKKKFEEEESRYFNHHSNNTNINDYNNKSNYRMFSELEELYHHGYDNHHHHLHHHENPHAMNVPCENETKNKTLEEPTSQEHEKIGEGLEEDPREEQDVGSNPSEGNGNAENDRPTPPRSNNKKRKRERFKILKGFCEGFVKRMIAQQEEMHKKLLEDMVKRDEEKIAREEAWKKHEMERINEELEIRAHEQAIASDRNATIIKFISKFTSSNEDQLLKNLQSPSTATTAASSTTQSSPSLVLPQNPSTPTFRSNKQSIPTLPIENPSSTPRTTQGKPLVPISDSMHKTHIQNRISLTNDGKEDLGKRWPKDEVFALINIRCNLHNNGDHQDRNKEGSATKSIPLWERISHKMLELGYKRSAKRCKEKWENINKYFRKTKGVNKKKSLDSRTCPYFHQLSALYSQGSVVVAAAPAEPGGSDKPETSPGGNQVGSLKDGSRSDSNMYAAEGEKSLIQVPGFDFEF